MNHHLKHALIRDSRNIQQYCQLQNWLSISERVEKGIKDSKYTDNIEVLVDSTIFNHPDSRHTSQNENRPLTGMREYRGDLNDVNKNSMIIKNQVDNKEYVLDCLNEPFRPFIPNFSDRLPLGSIVAGIYHKDVEKAKECHKFFVKNSLQEFSKSLNWFNKEIMKPLELKEDWQKKWFEEDLKELYSTTSRLKMVAHFDSLNETFSNLNNSLNSLIKKDVVNTPHIRRTEEYKAFKESLNKTIKQFNNPEIDIPKQKTTKKLKM